MKIADIKRILSIAGAKGEVRIEKKVYSFDIRCSRFLQETLKISMLYSKDPLYNDMKSSFYASLHLSIHAAHLEVWDYVIDVRLSKKIPWKHVTILWCTYQGEPAQAATCQQKVAA